MAPRALQYTVLDFEGTLAELTTNAAGEPSLAGLDLSEGSPDRRWFVAVATVGAKLTYYQNRGINEAFIHRARLRQSVIDHARGLAYELASPTPPTVTVALTIPSQSDAVPIAAGTEVYTEDGAVVYTTNAAVTFAPGQTSRTVACTEGRARTQTFVGESAGVWPSGQRVTLTETPFVRASETVTVGGVTWSRVNNFLSSTSASQHYVVERDADERATVVFGDGVNSKRPAEGATITVTYRTTLGTAGRVRRGTLRRVRGSFTTAAGLPVEVAATNAGDSSGGTDREALEHARYAAPDSLRATDRTVSREDFELHAVEVPGVARALCHTRREDNTLGHLQHRLYVVPTAGGSPDATLLDAVHTYVTETKPCMAGLEVSVVSAVYVAQSIAVTIYCRADVDAAALQTAAQAALAALWTPGARDEEGHYVLRFGYPVPRSRMFDACQSLAGVTRVEVTSPASDPSFTVAQFAALASAPAVTVVQETT